MNATAFRWASLTLAALAAFFAWDSWRNRAGAANVQAPAQEAPEYRLQIPDLAFGAETGTGALGQDIPYGGLVIPDVQTWETAFPDLVGPGTVTIPELTLQAGGYL